MAFHDEVEIEGRRSSCGNRLTCSLDLDFEFDEESETYYWPCPCGDRFQITKVSSYRECEASHSSVSVVGRARERRGYGPVSQLFVDRSRHL